MSSVRCEDDMCGAGEAAASIPDDMRWNERPPRAGGTYIGVGG